ncbi:hypothetical protein OEB99_03245 [Actinotalea sp. M2MS4P-6]|uniref:hypothetical protein n=1 Tax=Actinotalea sp. M2MS4P-6 TaxID=2983762 RepID=UPI0021E40990|nr:hypothetical protein [Actinotalea sp. M2MS4P-6]MCV2393313.1 hypothetical protein [Actinotalea sp. M2MS4P-6]
MTAVTVRPAEHADRAARAAAARAVLASAEERTGTRRKPWRSGEVRRSADDHTVLPIAPALAPLLPGGLTRGATVTVTGSTSLVLTMLGAASAAGSWVAVVGMPAVGMLAAHQLGLALDRVVLVPDPGPDGPRVIAALVDGVDAVVVGDVALADADRRRLSARARERSAVLVATTPWPGASVQLTVERTRWSGVGRGNGRLRDRVLTVSRAGRGSAARGWRGEVRLHGGEVDTVPHGGVRDGVVVGLERVG